MSIFEALQFDFFIRALIAGSMIAVSCSLLGNFIILRREALITHSISHIALLGIALSLLFKLHLNMTVIVTVIIGVILIIAIQNTRLFSYDSILELTAEIGMAGAIVTLSQLQGYQTDIMQYLFGDILAIDRTDIWFAMIIGAIVIVFFYFFHTKLLQVVFNEELALSIGTNSKLINFLFLILIGLVIAIGVKIVGVILLSAFLVIPANTAKALSKNFKQMAVYGVLVSVFGTIIGLFLSYSIDVPSGAMIILTLACLFVVAVVFAPRGS